MTILYCSPPVLFGASPVPSRSHRNSLKRTKRTVRHPSYCIIHVHRFQTQKNGGISEACLPFCFQLKWLSQILNKYRFPQKNRKLTGVGGCWQGRNGNNLPGTAGETDEMVAGTDQFNDNQVGANSETGLHAQQTNADTNTMAPASQREGGGLTNGINPCLIIVVILYAITIVIAVASTPSPFLTLLFVLLAILPAALIGKFIRGHLHDEAIPDGFLKTQFLFAAVPLTIVVIIVELTIMVVFVMALFSGNLEDISNALTGGDSVETDGGELMTKLTGLVPLWKWIVLCLFLAFVVAAGTEEGAKWLLARRYQKVNELPENTPANRRLTVRGILAIACSSALGLATVENLSYVLGISQYSSKSVFPFRRVGLTVLRDLLAFPIHVGGTFYIALAAAQRAVLGDGPSVLASFFVAVLFHGCFDAFALLIGLFIMLELIPDWVEFMVVVVQSVVVIGLMILCRSRFKSLIERERAVSASGVLSMV